MKIGVGGDFFESTAGILLSFFFWDFLSFFFSNWAFTGEGINDSNPGGAEGPEIEEEEEGGLEEDFFERGLNVRLWYGMLKPDPVWFLSGLWSGAFLVFKG